ncbi:MAG: hypothetical protein IJQ39_12130 [Thermoguttaceae bacterium]|nr:hypothetical protein [Thermoguttaceae bacterium]
MKQFILRTTAALFVLCGIFTVCQNCDAAAPVSAYYSNAQYQRTAYVNPAIGVQAPTHYLTPTQMRTGYTRQEIRAMPMIARPSRPGHFIGNTVRRRAGVGY